MVPRYAARRGLSIVDIPSECSLIAKTAPAKKPRADDDCQRWRALRHLQPGPAPGDKVTEPFRYCLATMDSYCAEYSGKPLRYSLQAGELRINLADLCSILGIESAEPETADMVAAIDLAEAHGRDVANWLRETFFPPWLHDQMRTYLK